ncbi:MAG TPA: hypothetical protein VK209_12850 [Candidatus Sulfotelmatobacter sp.]|jgi:hypothetical protein|nr:hypothetical protein [Candidatus Sulfotelmatobacter sp.]
MHNKLFKLGVSAFIIAEICFLGGLLSVVIEEYDPIFIETAGLIMIAYSIIVGIGVLLFALHQLHKWNPNVIIHLKNLFFLKLRVTM